MSDDGGLPGLHRHRDAELREPASEQTRDREDAAP
jgi:hypothetical protein